MADPIQMRAKEKRLAEALRANLRRRKELVRERSAVATETSQAPAVANDEPTDALTSSSPSMGEGQTPTF